MDFGINNDSLDESELLTHKQKHKRLKSTSRRSSFDRSFNKIRVSFQLKERCDIHFIIIKFYSILLFQQLSAFIACIAGFKLEIIRIVLITNPLLFILSFITCVVLCLFSYFYKGPFRKPPINVVLFGIFTLCYIYSIVYICICIESYMIMMAIFNQFVIIVALEIYITMIEDQMSYIAAGMTVIVAGGFYYFFFKIYTFIDQVRILLSLVWLILWGFYLIFWTKKIIEKEYKIKKQDFILAAFRFYLLVLFFFSMIYSIKGYLIDFLNDF